MFKHLSLVIGLFLFSGAISADGASHLSSQQLKQIFTDKTQLCTQVSKGKTCKTYNGPDGRVVRVMDADGKRREGAWWVSEEEEYCLRWDGKDKDLCFFVYEQDDGTYHLYKNERHKAIITGLLDGNPHDLYKDE